MKLLCNVHSLTEAKEISERLKKQGVFTFISSEESKSIGGVLLALSRWAYGLL